MQIDKEKLKQILNLSDEEIKKKVTNAVNAGNFEKKDKENLTKALQNMKDIKKALGNIDEENLNKAVNSVGTEKIEELKKNLNK